MTAKKKALPKVQVPQLTAEDCHNIIQLLNRVQTNGINEAQVLVRSSQKLATIKQMLDPAQEVGNDGEDANTAS